MKVYSVLGNVAIQGMILTRTVLMVTRPILPPWNEGSKNTAWQIAQRARRHHFHLMTVRSITPPLNNNSVIWNYVYTDQNFVTKQKFRLLWHLASRNPDADIYHFLFVPTLQTSRLFSPIVQLKRKCSIQTVPSIYKSGLSSKQARTLFFADKVVVISDWTANKLQSLGLENIVRVNVGIDLEVFKPTSNQSTLRKKLGLPLDTPVVLFSGELSRLNSTAIMLSVIQHVLDENAKIHFVFACPTRKPADMTVRQKVQQQVRGWGLSDSVSFMGEVDNFSELLNACDLLAYPVARMTGKIDTPLTVLEAMATEMPVILTDLPPLNEVLKDKAGMATPVGNEETFAHAIVELSNDEKLRREMGQAGREVVRAYYNIETMVKAYEDLYDELT